VIPLTSLKILQIPDHLDHKDHAPPHFHAKYNDKSGIFSITELKMVEGNLPSKVISLIVEWANMHKDELISDWDLAQEAKPLKKIEPLV